MFKASEVEITDEGLAFVCDSEAEAQRAYWEGQLRERKHLAPLCYGCGLSGLHYKFSKTGCSPC